MKLKHVILSANDFFFKSTDTWSLSVFRILLGIVAIKKILLIYPDLITFYTDHGFVHLKHSLLFLGAEPRINLFSYFSSVDSALLAKILWSLTLLFSVLFTLGLFTNVSALFLYVLMVSFDHRNTFVLHAGDALLRVLLFWMIFARSNAYYSLDRNIKWLKSFATKTTQSAWPLRALQIQICLMYLGTFFHKTQGNQWWDGTAVYTVSQLIEFQRFSAPLLFSSWISIKTATWFTLLFEGTFAFLVWFKETRYAILMAGFLFHATLEWTYNIPIFQWVSLSAYALFVQKQDLQRALSFVKGK